MKEDKVAEKSQYLKKIQGANFAKKKNTNLTQRFHQACDLGDSILEMFKFHQACDLGIQYKKCLMWHLHTNEKYIVLVLKNIKACCSPNSLQ